MLNCYNSAKFSLNRPGTSEKSRNVPIVRDTGTPRIFATSSKPRCVECAGNHSTSQCPHKERSSDVRCALCDGNHPANYKGCTVYKDPQKKPYPPLRPKQYSPCTTAHPNTFLRTSKNLYFITFTQLYDNCGLPEKTPAANTFKQK
jgi:hypothetical protein